MSDKSPSVTERSCVENLPHPRNPFFTGRSRVLEALGRSLSAGGGAAAVRAVYGGGGTGKTHLVLEYAYRNLDTYELIWWLPADEPSTMALHFGKLAQRLGIDLGRGAGLQEIRAAVREELRRRENWLLVFDNARGPDEIRAYLPDVPGHVLITSRNPRWEGVAGSFCLRVLERSEAAEFLLRRSGRSTDTSAPTLAQALGDLPLALEQAAALIEQTGISFSEYLSRFESHWAELLASGRRSGDYPDVVAMSWELACREVEQTNSEVAALLKVLAYLAPAPIPWSLLHKAVAALPVPMSSLVTTPMGIEDTVGTLSRFSLVTANVDAIFVHHFVASLSRDRLPQQQQQNWCELALEMMQRTFRFDPDAVASWGECGEALPHALSAAGHAEAAGLAPAIGARLLNSAGEYLLNVGQYDQACAVLRRASALGDGAYESNDPRRSAIANNLGRVLKRLGEHEQARAQFETALVLDQAAYGISHPHVAEVVNNYGTVLHSTGDVQTALKQFEWALEICRECYGSEHPKVATVTNNIGYALANLGDLDGAIDHFTRALSIAEAACGADHPLVASIGTNLGTSLRLKGQTEAAQGHLERAAAISESVLGAAHPELARTLAHLGALHQQQGDLETARRHFQRVVEIDEQTMGPSSTLMIAPLNNLGRCLKLMGDVDGSAACYQRAADILRQSRQPAPA